MVSRRILYIIIAMYVALSSLALSNVDGIKDTVDVAFTEDPAFLPYVVNNQISRKDGDREFPFASIRVWREKTEGSDPGLLVEAKNPSISGDGMSGFVLRDIDNTTIYAELPISMTIDDFVLAEHGGGDWPVVVGVCNRGDTAYVLFAEFSSGRKKTIPLASGTDMSGDNRWKPESIIWGLFDLDGDTSPEVLIHVKPGRDKEPRVLFCLDMCSQSIKWQLPFATAITSDRDVLQIEDENGIGLIVASYGPGNGVHDSNFGDSCGYLTRIDGGGNVVFNLVAGHTMNDNPHVVAFGDSTVSLVVYHCGHLKQVPLVRDSNSTGRFLSLVVGDGTVIKTRPVSYKVRSLWMVEELASDLPLIHVLDDKGTLSIYAGALEPRAVFRLNASMSFIDTATLDLTQGPVSVMSYHNGLCFYDQNWKQVAVTIGYAAPFFEVLSRSALGTATMFLSQIRGKQLSGTFVEQSLSGTMRMLTSRYYNWILILTGGALLAVLLLMLLKVKSSLQLKLVTVGHERDVAREKYRQVSIIAGGMAHEIRNALLPSEAALLRMDKCEIPGGNEIEIIRKSIDRSIDLTEVVSKYASLTEDLRPSAVSLQDVVEDACNEVRSLPGGERITIEVTTPDDALVSGVREYLHLALMNVLANALDASRPVLAPKLLIALEINRRDIAIAISNNGPAIGAEERERIFEPFYSTRPNRRRGLGLAIARRCIEICGGTLELGMQAGWGATFVIVLQAYSGTDMSHGQ